MTAPSVRAAGPPDQGRGAPRTRRPTPPEVPDHYKLLELSGRGMNIYVWHDRASRSAIIRFIDSTGVLDAGTVTYGGTDSVHTRWAQETYLEYDMEWLDYQAHRVEKRLADLWSGI